MRARRFAANALTVAVALLVGVGLIELALRLFFPSYQYAADARFDADAERIFANAPNGYALRPHPDTGEMHAVIHNNLGLRQHRDITEETLATTDIIAVFGDSFTENRRLPVETGYVEVLDYLLNAAGGRVTVLNYGTDG